MATRQAYAPLPQLDDNELEAAFQSDDDDDAPDTRALISTHPQPPELHDGAYDFEPRFEDYASRIPDGSPPPMPPAAGNSNGLLPGPPAVPKRPNWLTRTLSSFRRSQDQHARFVGRGTDGVFGNVVAKPTVPGAVPVDDDVRVLPEETRSDAPPNYVAAMADPAPAYWPETVHAPNTPNINLPGELIVDDLPSGSVMMFLWAAFVTTSFAWVGVFLAYLLNKTSHAGRHGARAGLGLWFIRYAYGLYVQPATIEDLDEDWHWELINGTQRLVHGDGDGGTTPPAFDDMQSIAFRSAMNGWMSIVLLFVGSMVLSVSIAQFYKIKRYEAAVLASTLPEESSIRNVSGRERPNLTQSLREHFRFRFAQSTDDDDEEQAVGGFPGHGRRLDGQAPSTATAS